MNNIWIYVAKQYAKGIVIAENELEALEKVVILYKKYNNNICSTDIQVVKATDTYGWESDCPDILEIVSFI